MGKQLEFSELIDFYGRLLTDKQLDCLMLYYNEDLSLSEIADELQISRQGVRSFLKKGEAKLIEYEEVLGLCKRFKNISSELDNIIDSLNKGNTDGIIQKIEEIKSEF